MFQWENLSNFYAPAFYILTSASHGDSVILWNIRQSMRRIIKVILKKRIFNSSACCSWSLIQLKRGNGSVWSDGPILKSFEDKFSNKISPNIVRLVGGVILKNVRSTVATFWSTFGKYELLFMCLKAGWSFPTVSVNVANLWMHRNTCVHNKYIWFFYSIIH